jgi:hypothetical protein
MRTRVIQPCLGVLLALAAASACDVEPATAHDMPSEASALRSGATIDSTVMAAARSDAATRLEDDSTQKLAAHGVNDESLPSVPAASFPAPQCRQGYTQRGSRLCIGPLRPGVNNYGAAAEDCRDRYANVCSVDDLIYLYVNSQADANYNPRNRWLGNVVDQNSVLCGDRDITSDNDNDMWNFADVCTRSTGPHSYWCCHDRE